MFVKVSSSHIINTNRIVEIRVLEAQAREDGWERVSDSPLLVILSMTGLNEEGNGREIRLEGAEAEKFLAALPVYEPIEGDS